MEPSERVLVEDGLQVRLKVVAVASVAS